VKPKSPPLPIGHAALERAIKRARLGKLAKALGVKYQLIQCWRDKGRRFAAPAEYCPALERETGVPCEELRPDIPWAVLRKPLIEKAA